MAAAGRQIHLTSGLAIEKKRAWKKKNHQIKRKRNSSKTGPCQRAIQNDSLIGRNRRNLDRQPHTMETKENSIKLDLKKAWKTRYNCFQKADRSKEHAKINYVKLDRIG